MELKLFSLKIRGWYTMLKYLVTFLAVHTTCIIPAARADQVVVNFPSGGKVTLSCYSGLGSNNSQVGYSMDGTSQQTYFAYVNNVIELRDVSNAVIGSRQDTKFVIPVQLVYSNVGAVAQNPPTPQSNHRAVVSGSGLTISSRGPGFYELTPVPTNNCSP
jgi:hypothetical protein